MSLLGIPNVEIPTLDLNQPGQVRIELHRLILSIEKESERKMTPPDGASAGQCQTNEAEAYEEKNVHEVYQQIAGHFSSTRYKVCLQSCR